MTIAINEWRGDAADQNHTVTITILQAVPNGLYQIRVLQDDPLDPDNGEYKYFSYQAPSNLANTQEGLNIVASSLAGLLTSSDRPLRGASVTVAANIITITGDEEGVLFATEVSVDQVPGSFVETVQQGRADVNHQSDLTVPDSVSSGTLTVIFSFSGSGGDIVTDAVPYNASASTLKSAIESALPGVSVTVTMVAARTYRITWGGTASGKAVTVSYGVSFAETAIVREGSTEATKRDVFYRLPVTSEGEFGSQPPQGTTFSDYVLDEGGHEGWPRIRNWETTFVDGEENITISHTAGPPVGLSGGRHGIEVNDKGATALLRFDAGSADFRAETLIGGPCKYPHEGLLPGGKNGAGILIRYVDDDNWIAATFVMAEATLNLIRCTEGSITVLDSDSFSDEWVGFDVKRMYLLEVDCSGNSISAQLTAPEYQTATPPSFPLAPEVNLSVSATESQGSTSPRHGLFIDTYVNDGAGGAGLLEIVSNIIVETNENQLQSLTRSAGGGTYRLGVSEGDSEPGSITVTTDQEGGTVSVPASANTILQQAGYGPGYDLRAAFESVDWPSLEGVIDPDDFAALMTVVDELQERDDFRITYAESSQILSYSSAMTGGEVRTASGSFSLVYSVVSSNHWLRLRLAHEGRSIYWEHILTFTGTPGSGSMSTVATHAEWVQPGPTSTSVGSSYTFTWESDQQTAVHEIVVNASGGTLTAINPQDEYDEVSSAWPMNASAFKSFLETLYYYDSNIDSVTGAGTEADPFLVTYGGGLEYADVRPPVFDVSALTDGTATQNEIQKFTFDGNNGTFDIADPDDGDPVTASVINCMTPDGLLAALSQLDYYAGNISVTGTFPEYYVEFVSGLAATDVDEIVIDDESVYSGGIHWTDPLAWNSSAEVNALALSLLAPIGSGNVQATGTGTPEDPILFEFVGDLAATNLPLLLVDDSDLTGYAAVSATTAREATPGQNEIQRITVDPLAIGGTLTALLTGHSSSGPIAYDADAVEWQTALNNWLGSGNTLVSGSDGVLLVEFTGSLGIQNLPLIELNQSALVLPEDATMSVQTDYPGGSDWWNDPANWTLEHVPTSGEIVVLGSGKTTITNGLKQRAHCTLASGLPIAVDSRDFVLGQALRFRAIKDDGSPGEYPAATIDGSPHSIDEETDYFIIAIDYDSAGLQLLTLSDAPDGDPLVLTEGGKAETTYTIGVVLHALQIYSRYTGTLGLPRRDSSGNWIDGNRHLCIDLEDPEEGRPNLEIGIGQGNGIRLMRADFGRSHLDGRILKSGTTGGLEDPTVQLLNVNLAESELLLIGGQVGLAIEPTEFCALKKITTMGGALVIGNVDYKRMEDYAQAVRFTSKQANADTVEARMR